MKQNMLEVPTKIQIYFCFVFKKLCISKGGSWGVTKNMYSIWSVKNKTTKTVTVNHVEPISESEEQPLFEWSSSGGRPLMEHTVRKKPGVSHMTTGCMKIIYM